MNTAVNVAIIIKKKKKKHMRKEGENHKKCFYLYLYEQNMLFVRLSEKGT